jgi:hypothetical protein
MNLNATLYKATPVTSLPPPHILSTTSLLHLLPLANSSPSAKDRTEASIHQRPFSVLGNVIVGCSGGPSGEERETSRNRRKNGSPALWLEEEGFIATKNLCACRGAKREILYNPREGERVVVKLHIECGFSFPPSDFFTEVLEHFGLQLHNLLRNIILVLSGFVSICKDISVLG